MKKLILIIALVLVSNTFFAQSVFDKFDADDKITAIKVNKKMFELMGKVETKDKESKEYISLVKKLDNLRVFVTSDNKLSSEMKSTADKYLKTNAMEELMRINEKGKSVKIAFSNLCLFAVIDYFPLFFIVNLPFFQTKS